MNINLVCIQDKGYDHNANAVGRICTSPELAKIRPTARQTEKPRAVALGFRVGRDKPSGSGQQTLMHSGLSPSRRRT